MHLFGFGGAHINLEHRQNSFYFIIMFMYIYLEKRSVGSFFFLKKR